MLEGVDVLHVNALEDLGLEGLLRKDEGSVSCRGVLPFTEGFMSGKGAGALGRFGIFWWFFGVLPFIVVVDGLECGGGKNQAEVSEFGSGKGNGHRVVVQFVLKGAEGRVGWAAAGCRDFGHVFRLVGKEVCYVFNGDFVHFVCLRSVARWLVTIVVC